MSLYNAVCGNNPCFGIYARILDSAAPLSAVPRFRDMYTREQDGKLEIVLYTRTGGGNREEYEEQNNALCAHPLYVRDWDDDFDNTFAHFAYSVPEQFDAGLREFHRATCQHPKFITPAEKFKQAMNSIEGREAEPITDGAIDVDKIGEAAEQLLESLAEVSTLEKQLLGL